jgi:hypothetical protein
VIDDDAWERLIRLRAERTASFREITRDGIELLGADSERARRMRIAHESFDWYAALLANAPPVPHEQRGGR